MDNLMPIMRVRKSANDEAKVQLAKLYFKIKINQEKISKERKKDNAATNKTLIKRKNSNLQAIKKKSRLRKKTRSSTIFNDALVGISANNEAI